MSRQGRSPAVRVAVLAGMLAILFAACTQAGTDTAPDESTTGSSMMTLPTFPPVYPSPPVTMAALSRGTLVIDPDAGCVTLARDDGHVTRLAFPEGTTVDLSDPARPVLIMEGCRPLADGDYAEFGGGGMSIEMIERSERLGHLADVPQCGATHDGIALVGSCHGPSRP